MLLHLSADYYQNKKIRVGKFIYLIVEALAGPKPRGVKPLNQALSIINYMSSANEIIIMEKACFCLESVCTIDRRIL